MPFTKDETRNIVVAVMLCNQANGTEVTPTSLQEQSEALSQWVEQARINAELANLILTGRVVARVEDGKLVGITSKVNAEKIINEGHRTSQVVVKAEKP